MANLKFLKGLYESLGNAPITEGQILITKDTREMFVDVDASTRIKIGDFTVVDSIAALEALDATKVPTSRLYYVANGNILARSNGTSWVQINKQPTAEEMKTLLGLGSMAYKSEVAEADLSTELKEKVNAAAEGNHSHSNKTVLDGITAEKVTAWDAAEKNAKDHADGLNTAMNTRVEALEAIDHEHANKALLDTYTQTEANLADAVAKKHSHTFNETELNKIVEGDVSKWNTVVSDHLTSADKTTLENAIKEAKKAGTDANTALEGYKVTNDAAIDAIEEDIAEIVDGTNGILAQAKSYSDGKLDAAKTAISAEIDADVKVIADELTGYKTSNDAALAGVKATADAAATKEYTDAELAKKVDKVTGKSLVDDAEITKLAGVSAGANKVEASANNGSIKIDGVETVVYTHPEKHAISDVTGLQDALDGKQAAGNYSVEGHKHVKADITDFAHTHTASEITDLDATIKGYDYATKTELGNVDKKFENYKTAEAQKAIDDEQDRRLGVIEGDYLKAADISNFETKENVKKVADDLASYIESNDEALAGVKATAEAARTEDEVNSQIDAKITALNLGTTYEPIGAETRARAYADGLITDANLGQYTTEQEVKDIVDGVIAGAVDGDTITGLANLVEYLNTHGGEAKEMGAAIDVLEGKVETIEGKPAYDITATQISNWDNEVGAKALAETKTTTAEVKDQIEAYGYATTGYADGKASAAQSAAEVKAAELDASLKTELQGEIDADVKVVNDALEAYKTSNNTEVAKKANSTDVYAKSETFTKEEVAAAIDAAVTAAHTWGSF